MHGGRGAAQALQVHLQHHGAHVWSEPHQRPASHHSTEVPRLVTAGHLRDVRVSQHLQSVFPFSGVSLPIFFSSSECDLIHGECIQTYVPYLFLVIPLGPVTLTGQVTMPSLHTSASISSMTVFRTMFWWSLGVHADRNMPPPAVIPTHKTLFQILTRYCYSIK